MAEHVFEMRARHDSVEFWTKFRLPFEPRGAMKAARQELHSAISQMIPTRGHILRAEFVSNDTKFFDIENVLTYNVGTSAFTAVARDGLHILRSRCKPYPAPSGTRFPHLHRYSLEPLPVRPAQAPWVVFELERLSSSTKPHVVWWSMCQGTARIADPLEVPFALYVEAPGKGAIPSTVKPLVDGIISGMHLGATVDPDAVARLSSRTGWPASEIAKRLSAPPLPVLQPRKVVMPYRDFVKWDPADELCEELVVVRSSDATTCRVWAATSI